MSMLYSDYTSALATILVISPTDVNFVAILPRAIEYAELRLYRDLALEANSARNATFALTAGNRNLSIPAPTFVIIDNINVVSPAGTTNPESGLRVPLTRISWDTLDAAYGSALGLSTPRYYALQDAATIAVGPWPDAAYQVEIIGMIRPTPLSAANTSTVLSTYFPDLMIAASMIFMSGYTRNFGSQSDDPKMASSWEQQYAALVNGAATEESRKRAAAVPG